MEFSLEGILETLLVGAAAALCLLSLLFLVTPMLVRVEVVRTLFRFFLYEEHAIRQDPRPESSSESNRLFLAFLLCAALYGAGLVAQSVSDKVTTSSSRDSFILNSVFMSDPDIRLKAFYRVGENAVETTQTTTEFERFVTDYKACSELELFGRKSPTCDSIQDRASGFYYVAKNLVYREESYFHELNKLQDRIDFTRAMSQCVFALTVVLLVGFALGMAAEAFHNYRAGVWGEPSPSVIRLHASLPGPLQDILDHWTHLAAWRCFAMAVLAGFLAAGAQVAWRDHEDEFDSRVFGYFLALAAHEDQTRDLLPRSTYHAFSDGKAGRFEPSAVESLSNVNMLLVANDKGGSSPLTVFSYDREGKLIFKEDVKWPAGTKLPGKIESIDSRSRADGTFEIHLAGSFDREGNQSLVRFTLDSNQRVVGEVTQLSVADPCQVLTGWSGKDLGNGACVIEGYAMRNSGYEPLLGVRAKGRYDPELPQEGRTFISALIRLKFVNSVWTPELVWEEKLQDPLAGISGLEFDAKGNLLILTSHEEQMTPPAARQVRGSLWRIDARRLKDAGPSTWKDHARHIADYIHKPEGLTVLDSGSVLVVFDDDAARKSPEHVPDTFPLAQNESVYTLVREPEDAKDATSP
jgi:hypothetical protein